MSQRRNSTDGRPQVLPIFVTGPCGLPGKDVVELVEKYVDAVQERVRTNKKDPNVYPIVKTTGIDIKVETPFIRGLPGVKSSYKPVVSVRAFKKAKPAGTDVADDDDDGDEDEYEGQTPPLRETVIDTVIAACIGDAESPGSSPRSGSAKGNAAAAGLEDGEDVVEGDETDEDEKEYDTDEDYRDDDYDDDDGDDEDDDDDDDDKAWDDYFASQARANNPSSMASGSGSAKGPYRMTDINRSLVMIDRGRRRPDPFPKPSSLAVGVGYGQTQRNNDDTTVYYCWIETYPAPKMDDPVSASVEVYADGAKAVEYDEKKRPDLGGYTVPPPPPKESKESKKESKDDKKKGVKKDGKKGDAGAKPGTRSRPNHESAPSAWGPADYAPNDAIDYMQAEALEDEAEAERSISSNKILADGMKTVEAMAKELTEMKTALETGCVVDEAPSESDIPGLADGPKAAMAAAAAAAAAGDGDGDTEPETEQVSFNGRARVFTKNGSLKGSGSGSGPGSRSRSQSSGARTPAPLFGPDRGPSIITFLVIDVSKKGGPNVDVYSRFHADPWTLHLLTSQLTRAAGGVVDRIMAVRGFDADGQSGIVDF